MADKMAGGEMHQGYDSVTTAMCDLHRQVIDTKIDAMKTCDDALENRMDGIETGIAEVRDLQTKILYAIIGLFGASILTLIGVLLGRAIDFGVFFH
jgi:hypothetical protein